MILPQPATVAGWVLGAHPERSLYDAIRARLLDHWGLRLIDTDGVAGPNNDRWTQGITLDGAIVVKLWVTNHDAWVSVRHDDWSLRATSPARRADCIEFRGWPSEMALDLIGGVAPLVWRMGV